MNEFDTSRKIVEIVHTYLQEGNAASSKLIYDLAQRDVLFVLGHAVGLIARTVTDNYGPLPLDWDMWQDYMLDQIAAAEASTTADG
jgi:hypothetical protein